METFGLTVVEAMSSGLPTFATCFGGPLEIIEHGIGVTFLGRFGDVCAVFQADVEQHSPLIDVNDDAAAKVLQLVSIRQTAARF